jgi:outer membrane lipoprotein
MRRRSGLIFLLFFFSLFISCSPISKNLRNLANRSVPFEEILKNPEAYKGEIVIWGGQIIETLNQRDNITLIEVLQKPLNWMKEPKESEESWGRFLALVEKYLDPHIYRKGREITVAGKIIGVKKRIFGELEYSYPLLLIEEISLWRKYRYHYPPPFNDYYFPEYPWGDYVDHREWRYAYSQRLRDSSDGEIRGQIELIGGMKQ